jgi:hypothetical protein
LLSQTNLTALIQYPQNYPPKHIRGTKCIDFIFGTHSLQQHIVQSRITPFYEAPWIHTDHCGVFINIHELGLFGATTHSLIPPLGNPINSLIRKMIWIQHYLTETLTTLHKQMDLHLQYSHY